MFSKGDRVVVDRELAAKAYGKAVSKAWANVEMEVVRHFSGNFVDLIGENKHGKWDTFNPLPFRAAALRLIDEPVVEEDWS